MQLYLRQFAAALFILAFAACTKTETIDPAPEAQNRIITYSIVNVQGDPISGAVNDRDSSITIYIPFYRQLVVLEPEITVPEGATVTPVSGTLIEDLLDVFRNGRDIKYTVTAKDGSKRTYTLRIVVQQPDLVLDELSTATDIAEFTIDTRLAYDAIHIKLTGSGFMEENELMKMVLVDETGRELSPIGLSTTNVGNIHLIIGSITKFTDPQEPVLQELKTGLYKIKVYSYGKNATTKFPVKINKL
ncbi:hypothetical protein [Chitinophaga barathri]|uniref:DUF5018 domain-containing protein n=1 Tax=Chitinophaga barathri TaxID=1647451 RepID=A0A3N4MER5_9BACT|nr:hypothetical protein [Chitinophaga barathri]RPD42482.1 hypothetical protein EG028_04720 [Chitinophaga barathri]